MSDGFIIGVLLLAMTAAALVSGFWIERHMDVDGEERVK